MIVGRYTLQDADVFHFGPPPLKARRDSLHQKGYLHEEERTQGMARRAEAFGGRMLVGLD